jgi:hypothetical protein
MKRAQQAAAALSGVVLKSQAPYRDLRRVIRQLESSQVASGRQTRQVGAKSIGEHRAVKVDRTAEVRHLRTARGSDAVGEKHRQTFGCVGGAHAVLVVVHPRPVVAVNQNDNAPL